MVEERTNNSLKTEEFDFDSMAQNYMEFARKYHEQYLIKGKK